MLLFLKFARAGTLTRTELSANFDMLSSFMLSIGPLVVLVGLISVNALLLVSANGAGADIFSIYKATTKAEEI